MIAIKNMEIPKICGRCNFWNIDSEICTILCQPNEDKMTIRKNCPLTEIVTCKDCKYCVMTEVGCYCDRHIHRLDTHLDKYCADAERKE